MPRRNTVKHGRRRTAKALPPKNVAVAAALEELALELVRRGRASEAILDFPSTARPIGTAGRTTKGTS